MRLVWAGMTTLLVGVLVGRLEPQPPHPTSRATAHAPDFTEHIRALQARAPRGFTAVAQPPFVVIGDESPATVRRRATDTVKWAVDRLKHDFFAKDPDEIIDIWLF